MVLLVLQDFNYQTPVKSLIDIIFIGFSAWYSVWMLL